MVTLYVIAYIVIGFLFCLGVTVWDLGGFDATQSSDVAMFYGVWALWPVFILILTLASIFTLTWWSLPAMLMVKLAKAIRGVTAL